MCDLMYPGAETVSLLNRVYAMIKLSPDGCTTNEIAARMGMSRFAIRPRLSELIADNKIMDSGRRRLVNGATLAIWVDVRERDF